jgi:two-component system, NtrC family, response regulator AtoC
VAETTAGTGSATAPGSSSGGWTLVLLRSGELRTFTLPPNADVVIGRDEGATVRVDHPRISRRHARLRGGEPWTIEDLGSRHGTTVRGAPLAAGVATALADAEAFTLGPFTAVLVPERDPAAPSTPASLEIDDPAPVTPPQVLATFARSPLTILIRGESGAGKEVLAETLHRLSGREGELLRLNCAGFHGELFESELFGHEKGAFTGAVAAKPGLLEAAAGGTVFLDEIGELPLPLQAKLLRAIEAREVLRVGATRPVRIDVRFLAATNRDLQAEIARGAFRLDLYYRLAVLALTIPPLRARPARLVRIAQDLVVIAARAAGRVPPALTPGAIARLQQHTWPGNVRELRNTIERAILLAGDVIGPEHVAFDGPPAMAAAPATPAASADGTNAERARIVDALERCAGNQTRAAKLLGISRATLSHKLALHDIPRPRVK